jgi:DNA-binding CsgD family transcriptional regulator
MVFVGRTEELGVLEREFARARAGESRLVLIEGEPGVGKSSLLSKFVSRLAGAWVLRGGGDESEMLVPYGVLAQLAAAGGERRPGGWESLSGPDAVVLAGGNLVRWLGTAQEGGDRPIVVVVDDLHWVDRESAGALLFAFRRLRVDRVLGLVSARPGALSRLGGGWERLIAGDDRAMRIRLRGFGRDELIALGEAMGIGALATGAVEPLLAHTGGSPLYCRALLEELGPEDLLHAGERPLPVPRTLAPLIVSRLGRVSDPARELVLAASVLGLRAPLPITCALAGLSDPTEALNEAVSADLLAEQQGPLGPELSFVHPLVHRAVYEDLSPARRRGLHRRAAALVGASEALDHRVAAATGVDPALAGELEAAAQDVATRGHLNEASRWLAQSASLSPNPADRDRRLLDAFGLLLPLDVAGAAALEPDVRRLPPTARSNALLGQLRLLHGDGAVAEQLLLSSWNAHVPETESSVGALAAGQLAFYCYVAGRPEDALMWAERAIASADGRSELEAVGLSLQGFALAALGRAREGLVRLASLPENANDVPLQATDGLLVRGVLRLYTDDLRGARRDLRTAAERVRAGVPVHFASPILAFLGETEFRIGAWDDAILHGELAVSLSTDADRVFDFPFVHAYAALAPACRGDWEPAERHVQMALAAAEPSGMPLAIAASNTAAAVLAWTRSDHHRVLESSKAIRSLQALDALGRPGVFDWRPLEIEALIATQRLSEADVALAEFEQAIPQGGLQSAEVSVATLHGSLAAARGDGARAAERFAAAWELSDGLQLPLNLAVLALADGQRLRRAGERRPALARLRAAREQFETLGARPSIEACDRELAAAGAHIGEPGSGLSQGLTPAELGVASLVASGRSNREVAEELYVTVKTVEFHLRGVFAKLGISSRHEIAAHLETDAESASAASSAHSPH